MRFGDVSDPKNLADVGFSEPVDVVVSCLASRTGGKVHLCPVTLDTAFAALLCCHATCRVLGNAATGGRQWSDWR